MKYQTKKYNFTVMWLGQMVSLFGTGMMRFAVMVWAFEQTNSAITLGWLGFFGYVPYILASPLAGVIVDRWDRRKILMVTDGLAGFITIFMLIQFLLGNLQIWHLLLAEGLTSALEAFQIPSFSASISLMVNKKDFARANGMFSMANDSAKIFAPILGGFLLSFTSLKAVFWVDICTFIFAVFTLILIRIPRIDKQTEQKISISSWWKENKEALVFIKERKGLLWMMGIYLNINFLAALTYFCILPALILSRTGGNQITLGTVQSFLGIGGLVGGLLISLFGGGKNKARVFLFASGLSFLIGDFLFAIGRDLPIWILAAFGSAIFIPFINSNNLAIWQLKTPPQMQGRVFAFRSMGHTAVIPLGYLLGGWLADKVFEPIFLETSPVSAAFSPLVGTGPGAGMGFMFLITCVLGFLTAVIGYLIPQVRNIEEILPDYDDSLEAVPVIGD